MNYWQRFRNRIKNIPLWTAGTGIGILFLVLGFYGGELEEIYRKAIMICLECIGIG